MSRDLKEVWECVSSSPCGVEGRMPEPWGRKEQQVVSVAGCGRKGTRDSERKSVKIQSRRIRRLSKAMMRTLE